MKDKSSTQHTSAGQTLLDQHRELLSLIDTLGGLTLENETNSPGEFVARDQAIQLLSRLLPSLREHLQAENESIHRDFEDAPALRAAFIALDEDHPRLLTGFTEALEALRSGKPWNEVGPQLEAAITAFRQHEAQEEALFLAHS